jgi:hypothetical protein
LKQRDASRIAAWKWQPGKSANPGGVPKHDIAKEVAQAIFLNNPEMIYRAFCKILRRGNAYAFQVLADRAFGKLKETHAIEHNPYRHLSDEQLNAKIKELEERLAKDLGYVKAEPQSPSTDQTQLARGRRIRYPLRRSKRLLFNSLQGTVTRM